jgi:hypothetical protein
MLAQVALERVEHGNMIAEADGAWFFAALGRKIRGSMFILKHSCQGGGEMQRIGRWAWCRSGMNPKVENTAEGKCRARCAGAWQSGGNGGGWGGWRIHP